MKKSGATETTQNLGKKNNEIPKSEVDAEYHRLLQAAIAKLSGGRNAQVVSTVMAEARKIVGFELQEEIRHGYTRRYQILDIVRESFESGLEQAKKGVIPNGASDFFRAVSSPDDERRGASRGRDILTNQ